MNVCIIIAWYYHKRDDTLQKWMDSLISDGRYDDLVSGIKDYIKHNSSGRGHSENSEDCIYCGCRIHVMQPALS